MLFFCIPSAVVSRMSGKKSSDCNNIPILNISFDGQNDPAMANIIVLLTFVIFNEVFKNAIENAESL